MVATGARLAVTVSVAALLVAVPAALLTTHRNAAPSSDDAADAIV